jgi:hypothetical protein
MDMRFSANSNRKKTSVKLLVMSPFSDSPAPQSEATLRVYVSLARGVK